MTLSDEGTIIGTSGTLNDITDRKRIEDTLRASEASLAEAQRIASLGSWETNLITGEMHWSDEMYRIFGFAPGEVTPTREVLTRATHPQDREVVQEAIRSAVEKRQPFNIDHRVLWPDGEVRVIQAQGEAVFDLSGRPSKLTGTSLDITERKRAEEELYATTSRLGALIENLQAGILVEDDSRLITHLNQEFCTMFNIPVPPQALIGRDCSNFAEESKGLFAEPEVFVRRIEQTLQERIVVRGEELLLADGRTFERDYIPIFVDKGYRGHLWQFRDITKRKEAEEEKARQARHTVLRADMNAALAKGGSLPSILQRCTECIVRCLDAAFARIWTLDEEDNVLKLQASAGMYTYLDGPHSRVPLGEYKIGLIAQEQRPHLTNDVSNDPRISDKEWAKEEGMVAFAGHPLVVEGQLVGVMAMFAREPLKEDTIEALGSVADAIAQGIKRKEAEEALRSSEAELRALFGAMTDVILTLDSEGRYLKIAPTNPSLLYKPPEDLVGKTLHEVFAREQADAFLGHIQDALKTQRPVNTEYSLQLGDEEVWFAGTVSPMNEDQVFYVARDITERKQAEKALKESERHLRTIVGNVPVVLFVLDREGVFTLSEGKGLEGLGLRPGEVVGRSVFEVYGAVPEIIENVRRTLDGEEVVATVEVGELAFETFYTPLLDEGGEIVGLIGVAGDITERKRAEEEIKEANRRLEDLAVLKADFTAMVAHELDTPLAVIRGYTEMLAAGQLEPADQARALARIEVETEVLKVLVADFRAAAAIERDDFAIKPRQVLVRSLLADAVQLCTTLLENNTLIIEIADEDERVWADPYRIGQVLRNLLSNAVKYSPDSTLIALRAKPAETPGHVWIEVADSGPGIHHDDLSRIFEKFGRGRDQHGRKVAGVGLGLYLSRLIVQAHGSDLVVDAAPESGSVFGFELEAVR